MKVVFAVNSYGLGHATRSLPLIREAIRQQHAVYVIGYGRSLEFLKKSLGTAVLDYFSIKDYSFSKTFSEKKFSRRKFLFLTPYFMYEAQGEHKQFLELHKQYQFERIISDARYGIYAPGVPSYFINHHIRYPVKPLAWLNAWLSEAISYYLLGITRHFTKLLIPDLAGKSLSNDMTHHLRFFKKAQYEYLGILSMMHELPIPEEYDYFFSISGPEPQRTVLENVILDLIPKIKNKKIVITLGKSEQECTATTRGNVTIFNFLNSEKQNEIMAKSKFIITRSGYSTLMDLAELGKKALLIPTDGQPEQEYLAEQLHNTGIFYARRLHEIKLPEDLVIGDTYPGFITTEKTAAAVKRFSLIALQ